MSQQEKVFRQRYYRNINTLASVGQSYFQVTSNLHMSQHWKVFKQRYYRNLNALSRCRPVLLSGNIQSQQVTAGETFQTTILSEP